MRALIPRYMTSITTDADAAAAASESNEDQRLLEGDAALGPRTT